VPASVVVLAPGHSARPLYATLAERGVAMAAKPFALGFRIEHPQAWLDAAQYGERDAAGVGAFGGVGGGGGGWRPGGEQGYGYLPYTTCIAARSDWKCGQGPIAAACAPESLFPGPASRQVMRGKGKLPVADYTLATNILDSLADDGGASTSGSGSGSSSSGSPESSGVDTSRSGVDSSGVNSSSGNGSGAGSKSAGSSSRGGEAQAGPGGGGRQRPRAGGGGGGGAVGVAEGVVVSSQEGSRGVYSFCMCPGERPGA
jgi:hypothetical protein